LGVCALLDPLPSARVDTLCLPQGDPLAGATGFPRDPFIQFVNLRLNTGSSSYTQLERVGRKEACTQYDELRSGRVCAWRTGLYSCV
jgi:hypothetical protein